MKRLWTALFLCATSCCVSLYLGQDNNYDLKDYHLYDVWALLAGRWSQDLFAAGPATYFCPFLDVPYYLVAAWLFPSHGEYVVALAGLPYGALLCLVCMIAARIAGSLDIEGWERRAFVAASVLVAGTGAATWSVIGTMFNDISIAVIVLAAFYQILVGVTLDSAGPSPRRVGMAGALLGAAMGLKLPAAIYVPAMALVVLSFGSDWRGRLRSLAIYGCCAFAAFAAVYGPWGWKLYQLTGNPFFPLLNGVFRSDWMTSISFRDERFLPRSALQWLFYPFYWTRTQSWLVAEVPFRDLRLAIAYVFLAGYAALALSRKEMRTKLLFGAYRPVHALVLFLASSYIVWLHEFSILRYMVATECLAGVFVVIGIMALARRFGRRAAWAPAFCVVALASFIVAYNVQPRWGRTPAGTNPFAVKSPRLQDGALVIFADTAMSFLAPGLAASGRELRFMYIPRGFASKGMHGIDGFRHELGLRMKAMIAQNASSIYVLYRTNEAPATDVAPFGIRIDLATCQPGGSPAGIAFTACRAVYAEPAVSG